MEESQRKIDEEWTGKVCPHCIYTEDCEGSISVCKEKGGFSHRPGASERENTEYIEKNIRIKSSYIKKG